MKIKQISFVVVISAILGSTSFFSLEPHLPKTISKFYQNDADNPFVDISSIAKHKISDTPHGYCYFSSTCSKAALNNGGNLYKIVASFSLTPGDLAHDLGFSYNDKALLDVGYFSLKISKFYGGESSDRTYDPSFVIAGPQESPISTMVSQSSSFGGITVGYSEGDGFSISADGILSFSKSLSSTFQDTHMSFSYSPTDSTKTYWSYHCYSNTAADSTLNFNAYYLFTMPACTNSLNYRALLNVEVKVGYKYYGIWPNTYTGYQNYTSNETTMLFL